METSRNYECLTYDKDHYIEMISKASDKYGNLLLLLMDKYEKTNIMSITEEEARQFYIDYILNDR